MSAFQDVAEQYIQAWNTTDPARRRALVEKVWTEDTRYVDPLVDVRGHDGVEAVLSGAQAQFGGLEFALRGPVDGHHDQLRFGWTLGPAGGEPVATGFDVAELRDGRLCNVLGFLDSTPGA